MEKSSKTMSQLHWTKLFFIVIRKIKNRRNSQYPEKYQHFCRLSFGKYLCKFQTLFRKSQYTLNTINNPKKQKITKSLSEGHGGCVRFFVYFGLDFFLGGDYIFWGFFSVSGCFGFGGWFVPVEEGLGVAFEFVLRGVFSLDEVCAVYISLDGLTGWGIVFRFWNVLGWGDI